MNETPQESVKSWHFIRAHAGRIVIGLVLMAAVYGALSVYFTYQREQRIARKIDAVGGRVVIQTTHLENWFMQVTPYAWFFLIVLIQSVWLI